MQSSKELLEPDVFVVELFELLVPDEPVELLDFVVLSSDELPFEHPKNAQAKAVAAMRAVIFKSFFTIFLHVLCPPTLLCCETSEKRSFAT